MKIKVITSNIEIQSIIAHKRAKGLTIGLIPTMGALHNGHLSLVEEARKRVDYTIASIFINPTQFDNNSDLQQYPRSLDSDIQKLDAVNCDIVYAPSEEEIYRDAEPFDFDFNGLNEFMEGEHRLSHFEGVVQVVKRLFEIIKPDVACFGLKDYQQYAIIKQMVNYFKLPVEIIGCPTIREKNGLAMSSRNQLLSPEDISSALLLSKTLKLIQSNYPKLSPTEINELAIGPLKERTSLEYLVIADSEKLRPIKEWAEAKHARAFIAAKVGEVRLIDNLEIF